ncbi:NAD(P)-binding domain-containing protein [Liquorilactobacillus sicerae]|uniref:NAD(P)-binding domain-containing protein n=1 Tax=Liquorilactobacillus sicerae TaxID=1416943 RepID=UPI003D084DE1
MGCEYIGQAIEQTLIKHEFLKESIYVSYHGNQETYNKLLKKGLADCVLSNKQIFVKSDVIFITIHSQYIVYLRGVTLSQSVQVISCIAGLSTEVLKKCY